MDGVIPIPRVSMIRQPMLLFFLLVLLTLRTAAERPSVSDSSGLEVSDEGHFVANRSNGRSPGLSPDDEDASPEQAAGETIEGGIAFAALAGAGSLVEVSSHADGHRDGSLAEVEEMGNKSDRPPAGNFQGCRQGPEATDMCKSLCYRIWCSSVPYGSCAEFVSDVERVGGWLTPEGRWCKHASCQTDAEYAIDIWYDDAKRNIPDHELNYYIGNLKGHQNAAGGGGMSAAVRRKFSVPVEKMLAAMELRQAYDNGEKALADGSRLAPSLKRLEAAISEVSNKAHYSSMSTGLSLCRGLAGKLSIITKLEDAARDAKPLAKATTEKADIVLLQLYEWIQKAKENPDDSFSQQLATATKRFDEMEDTLVGYFTDQVNAARNSTFSAGDEGARAMGNLKPIIERMSRLSAIDKIGEELPTARSTLEEIEGNMRRNFNDKVMTGQEALDRMAATSELGLVKQDLEAMIKQANGCGGTFAEEIDTMEKVLAQLKAWDQLQFGLQIGADAAAQKKAYEDSQPAVPLVAAAATAGAPAAPAAPVKVDPGKARLDKTVDRAKGKLRQGLDACRCAQMPDNFTPETEKAEALGDDLGGLPPTQPCPSKHGAKGSLSQGREKEMLPWYTRAWRSVFGGSAQTRPAALIMVMFVARLGYV